MKFHTGVDQEPRFDIPESQGSFFKILGILFEFKVRIWVWSTQMLQIRFQVLPLNVTHNY